MKIGVLSLGWPPVWAGGETYLYRIVDALNQNGIDAWGITATEANADYDSGDSQVMRIVPPFAPEITKDTIKIMFQDTYDNCRNLSKVEQIDRMQTWADMIDDKIPENDFDIGIIYVENLTSLSEIDYRKMFGRPFKKLISISFDIDYNVVLQLEKEAPQEGKPVIEKIFALKKEFRDLLNDDRRTLTVRHYNPEMEGILHITDFNQKVINEIFGVRPYEFVLHPLLESKWLERPLKEKELKKNKGELVVGMINPIPKKGSDVMLRVIAQSPYQFKILEGGHGAGNIFLSSLKDEYNHDFNERVELIHYVDDIIDFFDSIDVFFMPSLVEGYGQVAHESLVRGTPVITKRYPTIQEATLDDVLFIEPQDYDNIDSWLNALNDVFDSQKEWGSKARRTREDLIKRQHNELNAFIQFLSSMSQGAFN
jgi:glycosyltransferase involved in cell wall biosynthesis